MECDCIHCTLARAYVKKLASDLERDLNGSEVDHIINKDKNRKQNFKEFVKSK